MTPEAIFQYCSSIAMIGWLLLLFLSPYWFNTDKLLIGIIITLLAIVYAWLIFSHFSFSNMGNFGSLDGVMKLFQDKALVTAGWVHYLAFDLLTGTWIKRNAMKYGINHWILAPCLLLTFMLGPVGLLVYLLVRTIKTRHYFAENY
ncbi:MAG: DUF4281 domain-containing protein [Chitinophagales bacterium]|nr:DUF4281 domain-containing protein [Chitinophagales bacterium]